MRNFLILSAAALVLAACGGGNKTAKSLESGCEKMVSLIGDDAPEGGCACMSKSLAENLSKEDSATLIDAFSKIKTEEDLLMVFMPLMTNQSIMDGLETAGKTCDVNM